jgi:diguanylate cyclase (GGDEF)-like protein
LLLIDIDYFKTLNDRHGHPAGDACLQLVARVIETLLRPADSVARIGGDEFAVLLSNVGVAEAEAIAQRIGVQMQQLTAGHAQPSITLSIGGALLSPQLEPDDCLARADAALYEAKRAGRACVRGLASPAATTRKARREPVARNAAA